MRRCVIFAAFAVSKTMKAYIKETDYIIAADAGYRNATAWGLTPDLLLGDYDSAPAPQNVQGTYILPQEKDDTDTYYAAKQAVRMGFEEVVILGGIGGRLDHTIANIHTLVYLQKHGVHAILADENNEVQVLLQGTRRISNRPGWYLSVFPVGARARGVTLKGLKYPLVKATITNTWPVGTSNEFAAQTASVTVENGGVYLVFSRME